MTLQGSDNYIWDTQLPLGHGATSSVFLGRDKKTGVEVAVKVFSPQAMMRSQTVQLRECDVLRKLKKHDNIVQLLDVEVETDTRLKILVMELCSSSLQDILSEPENCFGLNEDEYLLVLQHITEGIFHLKENDIIHRDIKPGNILRHQCSDGRVLYKLTDFGAARELEDEERFMSLYGTEEYLHPDMYQRAVLREATGQTFDYNVDMWSLGVTLYHIATGQLPFRAYGGRKNKESMFRILMEKDTGVISGVQTTERGEIQWSTGFPCTCQLSKSLQIHMVYIIAGLLEKDSHKIWNYEKYFREVRYLLSKKVIDVFIPGLYECQRIYSKPDNRLAELKEDVHQLFNFLPEQQSYYFEGHPFHYFVNDFVTLRDYPARISCVNPLSILNMSCDQCSFPKWNIPYFKSLPKESHIESDYSIAKSSSTISHQILRTVVGAHHKQILLQKCMQMILCHCENRLHGMKERLEHLRKQFISNTDIQSLVKNTLHPFITALSSHKHQTANHMCTQENRSCEDCLHIDSDASIRPILERCEVNLNRILEELEDVRRSLLIDDVCCQNEHRCEARIRLITSTITEIWGKFRIMRKKKLWSNNDLQIHLLERSQLEGECIKAKTLFTDHCGKRSNDHWKSFTVWISLAIERDKCLNCLEGDLQLISTKLENSAQSIQNCFSQLCGAKMNTHLSQSCTPTEKIYNNVKQTSSDSGDFSSGNDSFVNVSMDTGEKQYLNIIHTSWSDLDETQRILNENNHLLESLRKKDSLNLHGALPP